MSIVVEKTVFRTLAETDADSVMAGKVDNEYELRFCGRETAISRMSEVNGQTETLQGYALEKATRPDLKLKC